MNCRSGACRVGRYEKPPTAHKVTASWLGQLQALASRLLPEPWTRLAAGEEPTPAPEIIVRPRAVARRLAACAPTPSFFCSGARLRFPAGRRRPARRVLGESGQGPTSIALLQGWFGLTPKAHWADTQQDETMADMNLGNARTRAPPPHALRLCVGELVEVANTK